MRILVLTNFYPPHELGGQGRSCLQAVTGLQKRGHQTLVLTSMHGVNNILVEKDGVARALYLEMDFTPMRHQIAFFTERKRRESKNLDRFRSILARFSPDVIFVWGMWNLARSLPALAEELCPGKLLYRFAEYWPTLPSQHQLYWQKPGKTPANRLIKGALGAIALRMLQREKLPPLKIEHAFCVSAGTRDTLVNAGIPVQNARIIYTGVDLPTFNSSHEDRDETSTKLLYAGRLDATKGIETAIEAVSILKNRCKIGSFQLGIAGSGAKEYESDLRQLAEKKRVTKEVQFLGRLPAEKMPALMHSKDILLMPSIWPEPFARVILEGMAAGMTVISSLSGGSGEIVKHNETGLTFPPGNAAKLAENIAFLAANPLQKERLAAAGQKLVREAFTTKRMIDQIEDYLRHIAES